MSNSHNGERSHSDMIMQNILTKRIQDVQLRSARNCSNGTIIKRALPSRQKRLGGVHGVFWIMGPVSFPAGMVWMGPHPHIGLQTFTWMIEGTMMHADSLGSKQLIHSKQVNLMMRARNFAYRSCTLTLKLKCTAQLWIALPDDKCNMEPKFDTLSKINCSW